MAEMGWTAVGSTLGEIPEAAEGPGNNYVMGTPGPNLGLAAFPQISWKCTHW